MTRSAAACRLSADFRLPPAQVLDHVVDRQHGRILAVHVEQIHRVRRFVPVEDAFFRHHHAKPIGAAVDDARADAAARAFTADQDRIHTEPVEMAEEGRAPKSARRRFMQKSFAGNGLQLVDDFVLPFAAIERFGLSGLGSRLTSNRSGSGGYQ